VRGLIGEQGGERIMKNSKKVLSRVSSICLIIIPLFATLTPVFAKDMNLPEGATVITYYSLGSGTIVTPANWPISGSPGGALKISGLHFEGGTFGTGDSILLSISIGGRSLPVAFFTTNLDNRNFVKMLDSGLPVGVIPNNCQNVSENDLKVDRHGNRITVELITPKKVFWQNVNPMPPFVLVTIPAFKFELDKVGGSFHEENTESFTGYTGSSNYTRYDDEMGFYGNGVLTCSAWNYVDNPMTDCRIVMHGIRTYFPPPSP
jgi:hypothetical protein